MRKYLSGLSILFVAATILICPATEVAAIPAPDSAHLITFYPIGTDPGYCDTLPELWPVPNRPWHIYAIETDFGNGSGMAWMDGTFPELATPVLYRYNTDVVVTVVMPPPNGWGGDPPDTLTFKAPPELWPPEPQEAFNLHEIIPEICWSWGVLELIDDGDAIPGIGDLLVLSNPHFDPPVEDTVQIIALNTGWFVMEASLVPVPTLTEWGYIIFGVALLGFMTWMLVRRRKKAMAGI